MVAADAQRAVGYSLSSGKAHDAPLFRELLAKLPALYGKPYLVMDKSYEGRPARELAESLGFKPVVPLERPASNPGSMIKRCIKSLTK